MELPPVATAALLLASCALAFAIRLFPVVNWGSVRLPPLPPPPPAFLLTRRFPINAR